MKKHLKKLSVYLLVLLLFCSYAHSEERYIYDSRGKRDPFVPLVGITLRALGSLEDVMSIEDINLQGIASDSTGNKVVIINTEMIREGETVGRVTIKKISGDIVLLLIDEEEYELNIYQERSR